MGILRLLLAVAVYIAHTQPLFGQYMVGGTIAVETFFMISGYYMFFILSEKYTGKGRIRKFFQSRFLRLFPSYAAVALLTVFAMYALYARPASLWLEYAFAMNPLTLMGLLFTQLTLVGQDFLLLFGLEPGLVPQHIGHIEPESLADFSLITVAWSLSVELYFYALAPLFTKMKSWLLVALLIASLLLKLFILPALDLETTFWQYRFFPAELAFFLAGGLAYRLQPHLWRMLNNRWTGLGMCTAAIALTAFFSSIPAPLPVKAVLYFVLVFAAIPFLFNTTKDSRVDRFIGELSYPLYLVHGLVLEVIDQFWWTVPYPVTLCIALAVSALLVLLLETPINAWRQKIAGYTQHVTFPLQRLAACACIILVFCITVLIATDRFPSEREAHLVTVWMQKMQNQDTPIFGAIDKLYTPRDAAELFSSSDPERMPLRIRTVPIAYEFLEKELAKIDAH